MRLVICEIALQEFQTEHGELPERLEQLVPEYLPAVPQDPFAGKPLTYHLDSPDSYRLYSIGRDRVDDGGRPEIISGGDMTYQTDSANPKPQP